MKCSILSKYIRDKTMKAFHNCQSGIYIFKCILKRVSFTAFLLLIFTAQNPELPSVEIDGRLGLQKILQGARIIDARTAEEFAAGHLDQAINIPHTEIEERILEIKKFKSSPLVVYCRSGKRAGLAIEVLKRNGFKDLTNGGGYVHLDSLLAENAKPDSALKHP